MKIGLDIHGVIDRYPYELRNLSMNWTLKGHEVHIITGQEWDKAKKTVSDCAISFTHHFSIVDHHLSVGTKMTKDENDTWWMDDKVWVRSKADYISANKIDIHFDDSPEYAECIHSDCTFVLVPNNGFEKLFDLCKIV